MSDTLVLNSAWEPIRVLSWEDAFTLLFSGVDSKGKKVKAQVIEYHPDKSVRSATQEWKVPSVIRLVNTFVRQRKVLRFSRDAIYSRDHGTCQYCAVKVKRDEFTLDHIIPKSRGGRTTWENTVVACVDCNQKKGSATPEQRGMKLISKPVKPTKLFGQYSVGWNNEMPNAWRAYMRDNLYWHGELDNDNV